MGDLRLTERDLDLLAFMAEHRLVLADHVEALLSVSGATARARLRALAEAGLTRTRHVFHGQPACHQITRPGLRALGSSLPSPRLDVSCYAHDVGAAWLWLAARRGTFGPLREVLGERRLRSLDGVRSVDREPLGVRLGGTGADGRERLHYPDLLLVTPDGKRIAVELELTGKGRTRREKILAGYAADARIDAVLYLVASRATGRAIETSARRLGIAELVHVQRAHAPKTAAGRAGSRFAERRAGRSDAEAMAR
jgi:hypothetical protein